MATVVRDECDKIHVEYFQKGETIKGEYYVKQFQTCRKTKVCKKLFSIRKIQLFSHFQIWKMALRNKNSFNEELFAKADSYFEGFDQFYILEGIQKIEKCWL